MNWDALGAMAELAGAVGVIGSLSILGLKYVKTVFVEFFSNLATDKHLADIWYSEVIKDSVPNQNILQA
jgi:hypothetical protein